MYKNLSMLKDLSFHSLTNNKFYYVVFAIISLIITILNVGGVYIIHFIDIMWPLNPLSSITNSFNIWSYSDYGYNNGINIFNFQYYFFIALLSYLPIYLQEIILLSALQFIGAVYIYRLFQEFIFKNNNVLTKVLSFSAAFPIIFSNGYWWDFIPLGFFLISFGAMFLYYSLKLLDYYNKNDVLNYKYIFLLGIASILAFSSNAPINANLIILSLILPFFIISKKMSKIKIFVFYSLIILIILFTNLWWIIPSYMAVKLAAASLGGPSNAYILYLNSHNANFFNIIEYVHLDSPYFNLPGNLYLNNIIYNISIYLSIILLLFVIKAFSFKNKLRKEYFISFIFVLLLDIIMMGVNSPIKSLEIYFINTNGILSEYLRGNPGTLEFTLIFILTILIVVSFYSILKPYIENNKKIRQKILVVLVLIFLILSFVSIAPQNYDGYAVPHYPYRSRMVIPSFDYSVSKFIKNNSRNHYTLLYPGGFLEQNITHGYDAYDILPSMIPQSLLIDNPSNTFIKNIYNYIDSSSLKENFSYYLYSSNIKYIVIEGDLGGNYPFGFNSPPNYPQILNHMNNTNGIKLVKKLGPDYIYMNENYPSGMISKANALSNSNIIDGDILPIQNITKEYYNYSVSNHTVYEPNATYDYNGINIVINKTSWNIISNLSYRYTGAEPIFYNSIPLNINTSTNPFLIIKLKGNNNTVIAPNALTSSNISLYSILNSKDHINIGYPYNNLRDNNNTATSESGCDHYLMSNNSITMIINLNKASPTKNIHYIYFTPGALNKVPGSTLNFTIESIHLGTYLSSPYGFFHVKFHVNNPFNYNYSMDYNKTGYTNYNVDIHIHHGNNPILLAFFTSYSPYWVINDATGISSYKIVKLNNDTTGIIIYPTSHSKNIEFNLYYQPQKTYLDIEDALIISYTLFFASIGILYNRNNVSKFLKKFKNLLTLHNIK